MPPTGAPAWVAPSAGALPPSPAGAARPPVGAGVAGAPVTAATVMTVLERVGLSALANQPARLLSQGQRRRLGLGRLLLRPTTLWVLDEPLTGLDRQGVELVSHLLAEHLAGGGLAVLTTHQDLPGLGGVMRELDLGAQA